jgi:putative salt-induced outer membrane protein YdiY
VDANCNELPFNSIGVPVIKTNMLKHCFILTLIILPITAACQDTASICRNNIKLSVLRAINILNPGIEISYERLGGNKFSTQFTAGVAANVIGKPFEKLHGYNIGLEEKYFFSKKSKQWKYTSLAMSHSNTRYMETTTGFDSTTNLIIVDTFTIARKITALAFNFGIQFYRKQFVLEINLGAGIKYRTVKHYDRAFEYKNPREPLDLQRAANVERNGFAFYLPVNINRYSV